MGPGPKRTSPTVFGCNIYATSAHGCASARSTAAPARSPVKHAPQLPAIEPALVLLTRYSGEKTRRNLYVVPRSRSLRSALRGCRYACAAFHHRSLTDPAGIHTGPLQTIAGCSLSLSLHRTKTLLVRARNRCARYGEWKCCKHCSPTLLRQRGSRRASNAHAGCDGGCAALKLGFDNSASATAGFDASGNLVLMTVAKISKLIFASP